ncbi:MAG: hypothetical protein ACRELB_00475 [Polyangiaceae bacterium]
MSLEPLKRRLPRSGLGWVLLVASVLAWGVIFGMIGFVLAPTLGDRTTLGAHDWDQMESHRYLVQKTILAYHQFPYWNPYACGGHPNWGGFESGTVVVSPWFPFYMLMSLPHALRVEVWGSALMSAVGAWLLASRFTRSPAARVLVVAAFAVDSRWALQITQGHTWHLTYGLTPWALYFFDRAVAADPTRGPPRLRYTVLTGACLALMIYTGGIYPVPQTAFTLGLYAALLAVVTRSFRPLGIVAASGALGLGLAAPKLFPVVEVLSKHPRLVESNETLDLGAFVDVLTSHNQDVNSGHAGINQWGWHEWGMYVGWAAVAAVCLGLVAARGKRETALKVAGLLLMALGFGTFDAWAPWPLLHHLPVFKSQHVPSRWMYPGILLLLVVAASFFERLLSHAGRARAWLEIALLAGAAAVAHDVATVSREATVHMFATPMPATPVSMGPFHTDEHLPRELAYQYDWAPASLTAEMANIGTIDCGTFPAFHNYNRDLLGHVDGLGARGMGDARYRGEVYLPDGPGTAKVTAWTPNEVTVEVHGAQAGHRVVLDQNYDPGWTANGARSENFHDTVSATLPAGDATVVFRYRPLTLWPGVAVFVLTCAALVWAYVRARRRARQKSSPSQARGSHAVMTPTVSDDTVEKATGLAPSSSRDPSAS